MIYTIDKHGQLNITTTGDIKIVPGEPDTFVLSREETEELRDLLRPEPAAPVPVKHGKTWREWFLEPKSKGE